jgi:hypothetical protein
MSGTNGNGNGHGNGNGGIIPNPEDPAQVCSLLPKPDFVKGSGEKTGVGDGTTILADLADPHRMRGSLRLVNRAARGRWPITPPIRRDVVQRAHRIVNEAEDPDTALSAGRLIVSMDEQNLSAALGLETMIQRDRLGGELGRVNVVQVVKVVVGGSADVDV